MLYNIFDLFFNKESHYGEPVHEFCFTLYSVNQKCFKRKLQILMGSIFVIKHHSPVISNPALYSEVPDYIFDIRQTIFTKVFHIFLSFSRKMMGQHLK
jgi:hypothetical protein